jgi:phosphatidate cytidylyltransferase
MRIASAVILAPLAVFGILYLPGAGFALVLGVIFLLGLWEWTRMVGFRRRRFRSIVVGLNALAISVFWVLIARSEAIWIYVVYAGVLWWFLAMLWLRAFEFGKANTLRNLEIKVLAGSLIVVPAWAAGVWLHESTPNGPWWALYVIVLIWVADVFAYFSGKRFGAHKLAPRISPGKTREGAYGAMAGALIYALVCGHLFGLSQLSLALFAGLSLLAVAFSIVGDLFESLMKRHANLKDSGHLIPGHGGILDRVDSLLAALPIFVAGREWLLV